jgi:hypothetical protein
VSTNFSDPIDRARMGLDPIARGVDPPVNVTTSCVNRINAVTDSNPWIVAKSAGTRLVVCA